MASNATVINPKEKLLIEYLLADRALYVKAFHLLDPAYFDKPLDRVVAFLTKYFRAYHNLPSTDAIAAETGIELVSRELADGEADYALEEIENHCQQEAMRQAILDSADLLSEEDHEKSFPTIFETIRKALTVKVDKSLGTDLFLDPQVRLSMMEEEVDERAIGIDKLDELLNNVRRGEIGIFAAGTSGGKSVMLSNLAHYMSMQKLNALIITLEISETLTAKRLDSITTGIGIGDIFDRIEDVVQIHQQHIKQHGNITIKKMPASTTTPSSIRTYLMEYHLTHGFYPDVLCLDYIDILKPDNRYLQGKYDIDEHLTFAVREILIDYDMYGFTASQLNREAADKTEIHYGMIAGGLSKVNASDFTVAIYANNEDVDNYIINVKQLKVRNSKKSTEPVQLFVNPNTLLVTDKPPQLTKSQNSHSLLKGRQGGTASNLKDRLKDL